MNENNVKPLEMTQANKAAETLVAAFRADPMFAYLQPDEVRRGQFIRWMSTRALRYGTMYGNVYSDNDADGVAVWLGPGATDMSMWRLLRSGFLTMPFSWGLGVMSRFNALDTHLKKIHKAATPGDHWYLLMLGVAPEQQGKGLGSRLIGVAASQADAAGHPCYLDTETEENVSYYQKRGFEVVGEHKFSDALTMWGMRPEPR